MELWGIQIDPEAVASIFFLITTVFGVLSTAVVNTQIKLKENSVRLIEHAEEKFSGEVYNGNDKHNYVMEMLYRQVPLMFRPFFSKRVLEQLVHVTFDTVHRFANLRSTNMLEWNGQPSTEQPCRNDDWQMSDYQEKAGVKNAATINSSDQLLPGDSVLQNRGLQGAVRIFTLRGRHGILFRAEYRVCQRKRNGSSGGDGPPAG